MTTLHIDLESRSAVDLKKTGVYVYAESPTTNLWCACYAFDDEPVQTWLPHEPVPPRIAEHVRDGGVLFAHNANFEMTMWRYILAPRYGWPLPAIEQWRCTMVMAMAMGLPGALDLAGPAAGVDVAKDQAGKKLMLKMAKPRRVNDDGSFVWWDEKENIDRLVEYCKIDVEVERRLEKRLRPLKPSELDLWHLDQRTNLRGVQVDQELAAAAKEVVKAAAADLDHRMAVATNFEVAKCSEVQKIIAYIGARGVETESIAKAELKELLAEDSGIPDDVRAVLSLRQEAARASVAKINALLKGTSPDGRARGLLQFHAATTGRWGGRRFQPQNLRRPELKDINTAIEVIASGDFDLVQIMYENPLSAVADILRGLLIAAPGHRIVAADYSAIEGRVLPWLAGEHWKVDAYRQIDESIILGDDGKPLRVGGEKQYAMDDMYCQTASKILGRRVTKKDKNDRQVFGKVPELACIAEGEQVLTDRGLVPIEQVNTADKVWDGVEFVSHDGVVCHGEKEVIEYDGLRATADHIVWVEGQCRPVQLVYAAASRARLLQSGTGRQAIRVGENSLGGTALYEGLESGVRSRGVCRLRAYGLDLSVEPYSRYQQGLPSLLEAETGAYVVGPSAHSRQAAVREPGRSWLQKLWRAWRGISLSLGDRCRALRHGAHGVNAGVRVGSHRQQWPLCAGQPAVGHEVYAMSQRPPEQIDGGRRVVGEDAKPVLQVHHQSANAAGADEAGGNRLGVGSRGDGAQELVWHPHSTGRARVYDIINAGPRSRFTVSGKLVHNCGYGGSRGAFTAMGKVYGVELPDEQVMEIVRGWREANPAIKQYWYDLNDAALSAISSKGVPYRVGKATFKVSGSFLTLKLPSGRHLFYPYPEIRRLPMPWLDDDGNPVMKDNLCFFKEVDPLKKHLIVPHPRNTERFALHRSYGGEISNNITQGTARDIMADALPRLEAAGYPLTITVHDEAVTEPLADHGSVEEMEAIMCDLPAWASGLPVAAEGFEDVRYRK